VSSAVGRKSSRTPDLLSIVGAAYAVDTSIPEWIRGLLNAADESIGTGLAGFACLFRANDDGTIAIDRASHAVVRQAPESVSAIFDGLTHAPPGWLSTYVSSRRGTSICLMTSELDPSITAQYRERLVTEGVHDGINIACVHPDRQGVLISLGVGEGVQLRPKTRRNLVHVANHIVAAQRLRRRISSDEPAIVEHPEGNGSLETAPAPVVQAMAAHEEKLLDEASFSNPKRALREAVRELERERTSRNDADPASGHWNGLATARWTLVDQIDALGTKYVLARQNAPESTALALLTPTEYRVVKYAAQGRSTKEVAYMLGIKDATVRVLLMRAVRRCGVRSRHELLKLSGRPDS
jgi:DNA-binding CsgD family transcriptional regulator